MASVKDHLATIGEETRRLNKFADEATAVIRKLEKALAAHHIGSETWLRDTNGDLIGILKEKVSLACGSVRHGIYYIGYGRDDGGALGFVYTFGPSPDLVSAQDLLSGSTNGEREALGTVHGQKLSKAPRRVRIAAIRHIPELLRMLAVASKETARAAEESMKLSNPSIAEIRQALEK